MKLGRLIFVHALIIVVSATYYIILPFVITLGYPFGFVMVFKRSGGSIKRRFKLALTWPYFYLAMGAGGFVQLEMYPLAPVAFVISLSQWGKFDDWSGWSSV